LADPSAATHVYLAAPRERRFCLPNTRFLIHQPSGGIGGKASDIAIQAQEIVRARQRIAELIARETGCSVLTPRRETPRQCAAMTTPHLVARRYLNLLVRRAY